MEAKIFIVLVKSLKNLLLTTFKTTPSSTDSLYNYKTISYNIKGLQKVNFSSFQSTHTMWRTPVSIEKLLLASYTFRVYGIVAHVFSVPFH